MLKTKALADGVCAPEEFGMTGEDAEAFTDEKQLGDMGILYQNNIEDDSDIYYESVDGEILPEVDEKSEDKETGQGEDD